MTQLRGHLAGNQINVAVKSARNEAPCSQTTPPMRLNVILGHALAKVVHHTKVVLGGCVALFGGFAEPFAASA